MSESGRSIHGYTIHEELGRGGFGVVYRATQSILKREVALKAILPQYANEPNFIRRFEREAETVAALEHPYIVPLFDFWRDPEGAYLVMRFIRGGSLEKYLENSSLSLTQVITLFDNIGNALYVAHRRGVVHRDIKPANILLDEESNAYLTDFGIAKSPRFDSETSEGVTGTLLYAAPEQVQEEAVSPYTDIYAMGIMLYEAVVGKHPLAGMPIGQVLYTILTNPIPDIRETAPDLPAALNDIIQRATAKAPNDRYPDIRAMLADLHALEGGTQAGTVVSDTESALVALDNPYKGLRAFQEYDRGDFYGREALTDDLLRRFEQSEDRFLAVVGPSGSGKSSVVHAGMIPRLRESTITGAETWFIVEMFPGSKPFVELEAALLRIATIIPDNLLQTLHDDNGITRALKQILPNDTDELLLVIDQFEELFTLVESEAIRTQFITNLLAALQDAQAKLRVIITIRADFLDRPLYYDDLGQLIGKHNKLVLPLSSAELERAIRRPAESIGAVFETGLVARIVQDVQGQPGALPLLQYALTEMFEQRRGYVIPIAAHDQIGGIIGALGKRADEVYNTLAPAAQTTARQLFLRLVTLGEGTEDTRRRVPRAEVASLHGIDAVLDAFGQARLLTFDYDPTTREPTLEVAHEALIRNWETLREWLNTTREDLRILVRLRQAAHEWLAAGCEPSYLASGLRLQEYESWVSVTSLELSVEEANYLNESITHEEALREREEARKAEQARIARRVQNFRRASIILGVMVVIALIAVGAAFRAFVRANNQAATATVAQGAAIVQVETATAALSTADSQQTLAADLVIEAAATGERLSAEGNAILVAARARDVFDTGEQPLGLRLAYEANNLPNPPLQNQRILSELAYAPGIRTAFLHEAGNIWDATYSPDRTQVVTSGSGGRVILWNAASGAELRRFEGHTTENPASAVAFSPDGDTLASGSVDSTIIVWDIASGAELQRYEGHTDIVRSLAFSPDGLILASGSEDNALILWDVASGSELQRYEEYTFGVESVAFSPDGRTLATGSDDGRAILWDIDSGDALTLNNGQDIVRSVVFSPDGRQLAVGSGSVISLWDPETGEELQRLVGHSETVYTVAFSSDGTRLVSGSQDSTVIIWDVELGTQLNRLRHAQPVVGVDFSLNPTSILTYTEGGAFIWDINNGVEVKRVDSWEGVGIPFTIALSPDETQLAVLNAAFTGDVEVILWDLINDSELWRIPVDGIRSLEFSPDGRNLFGGDQGDVIMVDILSGGELRRYMHEAGSEASDMALSSDGAQLASGTVDGDVILWDVPTATELQRFAGHTSNIWSIAFSPDSTQLVAGAADGSMILWDVATATELHSLAAHTNNVLSIAFSPDGALIASGDQDGQILLWDATTGVLQRSLVGHTLPVGDMAFTRDGTQVISVSSDGSVIVWDVATGATVRRFADEETAFFSLAPFSDGRVAVAQIGQVVIARNDSLAQLQDWVRRNRYLPELSCQERMSFGLAPCTEGTPLPSPTIPPTATLLPSPTIPIFTPIASPTASNTPLPTSTPLPPSNASLGNNEGTLAQGERQRWIYNGEAGQRLTIDLESDDFDTYLYLYDAAGQLITENDDGDIDTNSQLVDVTLPADGTLIIEVASVFDSFGGTFTLTISPSD